MVIELRRTRVFWFAGILGVIALFAIGYVASPRTGEGRPVLLSPSVRALEKYRRALSGWTTDWDALQTQLERLTTAKGDLLTVSQAAQQAFEQALDLSRAVDATDAPASLIGPHDQAALTAQSYVDASLAVANWVSAPSVEHAATATDLLARAQQTLSDLESNAWLQQPY